MAEFQFPLRDMSFVLYELFKADAIWQSLPKLAENVDRETADAILQECS